MINMENKTTRREFLKKTVHFFITGAVTAGVCSLLISKKVDFSRTLNASHDYCNRCSILSSCNRPEAVIYKRENKKTIPKGNPDVKKNNR
jgi:hypothetical protein